MNIEEDRENIKKHNQRKTDKFENFLFFILSLFFISISTIKKKIMVKNKDMEIAKIKNSSPL